jgi:hypothetical protein
MYSLKHSAPLVAPSPLEVVHYLCSLAFVSN